jgi:hypothetical protein
LCSIACRACRPCPASGTWRRHRGQVG